MSKQNPWARFQAGIEVSHEKHGYGVVEEAPSPYRNKVLVCFQGSGVGDWHWIQDDKLKERI